jgi:hypothetical protein
MMSPDSYVFYANHARFEDHVENANLTRVIVTDTKITVYNKRLMRNPKTDVLYEKIIGKDIFSLHENRNGTKYLKHFRKVFESSDVMDISLSSLTKNLFKYPATLMSSAGEEFIEKSILSWFDYDDSRSLNDVKALLLFPALRNAGLSSSKLPMLLQDMQKDYGIVTKALRENDSWLAFIMDICKPTMKTVNDAAFVHANIEAMLPVAMMNLGMTVSELAENDKYALLEVRKSFMEIDLKFIHFMFKYIPSAERNDALVTLLVLVRAHQARRQLRNPKNSTNFAYVNTDLNLNKVPLQVRPKLATEFLKSLQETYTEVCSSVATSNTQITTELCNVFRYWFYQVVMEPSFKTEITVETLDDRFKELFNAPLRNQPSPIVMVTKGNLTFCVLKQSRLSRQEIYSSDVFLSLKALAKNLPRDRGIQAGYHFLNGYVAADGDFMLSPGEFYSLEDIQQIIDEGVTQVDAELAKLGRDITPENRTAFLTLGIKERRYKGTWKYYDLGVTDPDKILLLKKNGISSKRDIQTYSALPDEMFYEFLALHSG